MLLTYKQVITIQNHLSKWLDEKRKLKQKNKVKDAVKGS